VVHFKHRRYCLVNVSTLARFGADHYVVGEKGTPGKEGTWRDAEDGQLSGNAAASGSVDSTIGVNLPLQPHGEQVCYMWIAFGMKYNEVKAYNSFVWEDTPAELIRRTHNFWTTWLSKEEMKLDALPENVRRQFQLSLLILRTQADLGGGILSSTDSESRRPDNGLYTYVWPREAGITALGLDAAGYTDMVRCFYLFCTASQAEEGFMLPKYYADGAMGPLPHPWIRNGARSLPIQEDETAILLIGLWRHFERCRDLDFIDPLYHEFIVGAAEFLAEHIDHDTNLPLGSYDLWEERFGIHTFTAATVVAGLWAAGKFARAFGDTDLALKCNVVGDRMKAAMVTYLYHNDLRRFARSASKRNGGCDLDMTLDASLTGLWAAGVFSPDDPRIVSTMQQLRQHLTVHTDIGGIARYQGDPFHRVSQYLPGNPWLVPTMWMAQWDIVRATNVAELTSVLPQLEWVCHRALPSGVLPEQVNPYTGEPISATPSTFAHGKFVHDVMLYLEKLEALQPEVTHRRTPRAEMRIYAMTHISTEEIRRATPEVIVP
jgi:glucoamylase